MQFLSGVFDLPKLRRIVSWPSSAPLSGVESPPRRKEIFYDGLCSKSAHAATARHAPPTAVDYNRLVRTSYVRYVRTRPTQRRRHKQKYLHWLAVSASGPSIKLIPGKAGISRAYVLHLSGASFICLVKMLNVKLVPYA